MEITSEILAEEIKLFMAMMAVKYPELTKAHSVFLNISLAPDKEDNGFCPVIGYGQYKKCCDFHDSNYAMNILQSLVENYPQAENVMRLFIEQADKRPVATLWGKGGEA